MTPLLVASGFITPNILKYYNGLSVWWPLDENDSTLSNIRALNPGVAIGKNIVINGTFATDTTWAKGTGWTISAGTAAATAALAAATLSQSIPMVVGRVYSVAYDVVVTIGSVKVQAGTGNSGTTRSASGTYTETLICTANTTLQFNPVTTFTGTIDNVIVTELSIPPSNCFYTNPTLLVDGDMEAVGTAAWTAGNSATLSKQTGTPFAGSQVLRVARNSVSGPYAGQTILTIGMVYRVYGYVRSDGSATPRITTNGTTTGLYSGTTSTNWQSFDIVFVATATDLNFGTTTNTGTQYAEFDNCTVVLDMSLRLGELLQDGNMEASGTGVWVALNSATLSKQGSAHAGSQCLRVAYGGTNNPVAQQTILVIGKTYRFTGYFRGDGTFAPRVTTLGESIATGTSSTNWQYFDATVLVSRTTFGFQPLITSSGYTEYDDISVTEVSPLVGLPVNGAAIATPTYGHLYRCAQFDGSNDAVNIYSAQLNSIFNPDLFTIIAWARVSAASVWTDSTARGIVRIGVDTNNEFRLRRNTTNNQLNYLWVSGGTSKGTSFNVDSTNTWFMMAMTVDKANDQKRSFYNGLMLETLGSLGAWAGNLGSTICAIGSLSSTGTTPWSGSINDVRLYNRVLNPNEIYNLYKKEWTFYK